MTEGAQGHPTAGEAPPPDPGRYRHHDPRRHWRRVVDLVAALVVREFKGQYRRSLLGPAWALLQPLAYMAIFLFLRGVLEIPSDGAPYALFAFSALVPWTFFANAVTRCAPSVVANAGILKKVAVPREVFPVAALLATAIELGVSSLLLVGLMAWFGMGWSWHLLWLPGLALLAGLLALGIGLAVAAVGTFKRDLIFAIPFLMQFWLLATPVIYPLGQVPQGWQGLYLLNPMVGVVEGFRTVVIKGVHPDPLLLGYAVVGTLLVWAVGWPLFRAVSQYFADVL